MVYVPGSFGAWKLRILSKGGAVAIPGHLSSRSNALKGWPGMDPWARGAVAASELAKASKGARAGRKRSR